MKKKKEGGGEKHTLHDQKVVGSIPTMVSVMRPSARCFISSCFTLSRCSWQAVWVIPMKSWLKMLIIGTKYPIDSELIIKSTFE